jgi:hypothetical protein
MVSPAIFGHEKLEDEDDDEHEDERRSSRTMITKLTPPDYQ